VYPLQKNAKKKAPHLSMRGFRCLLRPGGDPAPWAYMKDGISGASIWLIVRLPSLSKKNSRPAKRLSGS